MRNIHRRPFVRTPRILDFLNNNSNDENSVAQSKSLFTLLSLRTLPSPRQSPVRDQRGSTRDPCLRKQAKQTRHSSSAVGQGSARNFLQDVEYKQSDNGQRKRTGFSEAITVAVQFMYPESE